MLTEIPHCIDNVLFRDATENLLSVLIFCDCYNQQFNKKNFEKSPTASPAPFFGVKNGRKGDFIE